MELYEMSYSGDIAMENPDAWLTLLSASELLSECDWLEVSLGYSEPLSLFRKVQQSGMEVDDAEYASKHSVAGRGIGVQMFCP